MKGFACCAVRRGASPLRREEHGHLSHRVARLIAQGRIVEAERLHRQIEPMAGSATMMPPHRFRLAHAALLLLVIFWPGSSSQAPVRKADPAVEAGAEASHGGMLPCRYSWTTPQRRQRIS